MLGQEKECVRACQRGRERMVWVFMCERMSLVFSLMHLQTHVLTHPHSTPIRHSTYTHMHIHAHAYAHAHTHTNTETHTCSYVHAAAARCKKCSHFGP